MGQKMEKSGVARCCSVERQGSCLPQLKTKDPHQLAVTPSDHEPTGAMWVFGTSIESVRRSPVKAVSHPRERTVRSSSTACSCNFTATDDETSCRNSSKYGS